MFKKWLKDECNIKLRDYKKLSYEEKLSLFEDWVSSRNEERKCPCCEESMLCGDGAWDGRLSCVDYSIAMIANKARKAIGTKGFRALVPTMYVCRNCGFVGLFLSKEEQKIFKETCCDIDYHED